MERSAPLSLPLVMLDPKQIKSDRIAYQFRLGSAETGEVESHTITDTEWNPLKHGAPLIVHKRLNGDIYVVDGHHRLAFAKRLMEEGRGPSQLAAYVLEEEKGISVKDAKLMAAYADISRGKTNVGDAASAIKEASTPDPSLHTERLPELPNIGNIPTAYKLSSLSYGSLEKISSGMVPVEAAEMVVDKVKDHAKRDRVIEIIGQKLQQSYSNYQPNMDLAAALSPQANDNQQKSFVDALNRQRAATQSFALGA